MAHDNPGAEAGSSGFESQPMHGRYYIETWGCQMNVHDTEKLAGILENSSYSRASGIDDADIILLNTCSVREKASEKFFNELWRLGKLKKVRPGLVLGVCGCVAQQEGSSILDRAPYVDFVIGPRSTGALSGILDDLRKTGKAPRPSVDTELRLDSIEFPYEEIRREGTGKRKAFVTIIEGCNHRCSFCIVPTTRGREANREMTGVLEEVRFLASRGIAEIEFLGQTVNAFRDSEGNRLGDLLSETAMIDGIERIRFTTSHPNQMTESLMDAMAGAHPKVCPYLHLPVQAGSSRVLRDMKRGYDRAGYIAKVEALRKRIPGISLGTDIIVGFPTETEGAFQETLSLLRQVRFDTCYSFAYSARPGTEAADHEDRVPLAEKMDRLARLQAIQKDIQARGAESWLGRVVDVLVEGPSKRDAGEWTGRTPENRIVNFAGDSSPGAFERVKIVHTTAFSMKGELQVREA